MGYALLFESMLESVLLCRDRWLKPGGAILPDKAVIYVAAGDSSATGLDFWDHVYGFDFPDIKAASRSSTLAQPLVAPVASSALLGAAAAVKAFDLTSMSVEDVDFSSDFNLAFDRDGECHALVLWFDTPFSERFCSEESIVLSTSPSSPITHWVQTVFVLEHVLTVQTGQALKCRCSFARSAQHRSIDISFEVEHRDASGVKLAAHTQGYVMSVSGQSGNDSDGVATE